MVLQLRPCRGLKKFEKVGNSSLYDLINLKNMSLEKYFEFMFKNAFQINSNNNFV